MSTVIGYDQFENTIQKTNQWLKEIMLEAGFTQTHQALLALRAVLHALRDRLTVQEAAELGAQLPVLIRGYYYEGWSPAHLPVKERHKDVFLSHILSYFQNDPTIDPEVIARSVFRVLSRRVSAGEISDIVSMMPVELRELWTVAEPV